MIRIKCTSLEIPKSQFEQLVEKGADIECTCITITSDESAPKPAEIKLVIDKNEYEDLWSCGTAIERTVHGTKITIIHEDFHA